MTHEEYAAALRNIAEWIEAHPDIPVPDTDELNIFGVHTSEDAARLVRAFGVCKKQYGESLVRIVRDFGGIVVKGIFARDQVCERVIVGKRTIPEHVIEARPAEVIQEYTEDIVEWRCPESILEEKANDSPGD